MGAGARGTQRDPSTLRADRAVRLSLGAGLRGPSPPPPGPSAVPGLHRCRVPGRVTKPGRLGMAVSHGGGRPRAPWFRKRCRSAVLGPVTYPRPAELTAPVSWAKGWELGLEAEAERVTAAGGTASPNLKSALRGHRLQTHWEAIRASWACVTKDFES